MKTICFIRHAKSDWTNSERDDIDRPLNKRGLKAAVKMGKRMSKVKFRPDIIKLSPSHRTVQTMELFTSKAGWETIPRERVRQLYLASVADYIQLICNLNDRLKKICFCGHNPTVTTVVNQLSNSSIANIPTCGFAIVEFNTDLWIEVGRNTGKLSYFDFPKNT